MPRSIIAGGTSYRDFPFGELATELHRWAEWLREAQREVEHDRDRLTQLDLWDGLSNFYRGTAVNAGRFFGVAAQELDAVANETTRKVEQHHIVRLEAISKTSKEYYQRIRQAWGEERNPSDNEHRAHRETFHRLYDNYQEWEAPYRTIQQMSVDLSDLPNLVERLGDFVGMEANPSPVSTGMTTSTPWRSGSFYLIAVVVVIVVAVGMVVVLSLVGLNIAASIAVVLALVAIAVVSIIVIGALQLRNDDRLSEPGFIEVLRLGLDKLGALVQQGSKSTNEDGRES